LRTTLALRPSRVRRSFSPVLAVDAHREPAVTPDDDPTAGVREPDPTVDPVRAEERPDRIDVHRATERRAEFEGVDVLAERGPTSVSELADTLDVDPSTVSHHLSRLEEVGAVERERRGRAVLSSLSVSAERHRAAEE
jgi:DNA-binding transcriptional ArsR family regulator